ncbi:hypothetical protein N7504_011721 [Penicillium tannophilum]|nr:hypothetical protein N7504_011721 [Penicillium tannophilum]
MPAFMLDPAFILDPTTVDQYTQLLAPDNLPMNYYLEPTDFSAMAMTRAGTVIFPFLISHAFYMIYNQSCQDGRVRILNFGSNGQVMHEAWLRPFQIGPLTQIHFSLGLHWYELLERPDTLARWNKTYLLIGFNPLSPTYPTLYSIKISLVCGDLSRFNDYTPAEWAEEFERFAPEFLAYESQGRVAEYSWDRSMDASTVEYLHVRSNRQMAAALGR